MLPVVAFIIPLFMFAQKLNIIDNVLSQIPIGRLGKPEEVASVILFLLGPDASYINAQTINVDGGMMPS
mgnify:CR=1 FL=1